MPLVGFLQENAVSQLDESKQITFTQFEQNPALYAPRLAPASEALLWSLFQLAEDRQRVPSDEITASEIGDPTRMIWLKATNEYYSKPSSKVHGMMGNLKHANLLRPRAGIWTSLRLEDDLGSGELDTFIVRSGQLDDLKNIGAYKAKLILNNGVQKDGWEYWMQQNRYADLLENPASKLLQFGENGEITRTPWIEVLKGKAVKVRRMTLQILPRDVTRGNYASLAKVTEVPYIISVDVPRIPTVEVRRAYTAKLAKKRKAFADCHAPICRPEEVWLQDKGKYPARCAEWCPVRDICVAYQQEIGEPHYLDEVNLEGPES